MTGERLETIEERQAHLADVLGRVGRGEDISLSPAEQEANDAERMASGIVAVSRFTYHPASEVLGALLSSLEQRELD